MLAEQAKPGDWRSVISAIRKLDTKLGPHAKPTFAGVTLTTPLTVPNGGTGVATLTDHGILLGSGTDAITPLGVATNGQLPIGSTGADPVLATLTGTANQVIVANAAGSITLSTPQDIHTGASPTFAGLHINSAEVVSTTLLTLESDINNTNEYNEILFKVVGGQNYGAIRSCIGGTAGDSYMSLFTTTNGGTLVRQVTIQHDGRVGFGTFNPETLLTMVSTVPYLTLYNVTEEDIDGGGEVRIIGKREDGDGTPTAAGQIEISHDGSGVNDQLGKMVLSVNTGAGLTQVLEIGSDLLATFAGTGKFDIVYATGAGTIWSDGTTGSTPASGAGIRLMWIPDKYAFRAGQVTGTEWNAASIGDGSFACGYNSIASGLRSVAMGWAATASNTGAFAFGRDSMASAAGTIAIGSNTDATQLSAIAIGDGAQAIGSGGSVAIGNSTASGASTVSLGTSNVSSGQYSFSAGNLMVCSGIGSIGLGLGQGANDNAGDYAIAMGYHPNITAAGDYGIALGHSATVQAAYGVAIGDSSLASGTYGVALGWATASGVASYALGGVVSKVIASAAGAIAIGDNFINSSVNTLQMGYSNVRFTLTTSYIRLGVSPNYSEFEANGTLKFVGTATTFQDINIGAIVLSGPVGKQPGIANFLDEAGADTGIATHALAVGEALSGQIEMQHDYKEGSNITFHIHWQGIVAPTGTEKVQFRLTYTVGVEEATLDPVTIIPIEEDYDVQYEFKRTNFAAIAGTNINIEDQFIFTLERIAASADEYGGEALIATVGIHYEQDTVGSRTIDAK